MIERTYRYYGGVVEAQFELVNVDLPSGKSIGGQHRIVLVPKFRIFEYKEITKEDFENFKKNGLPTSDFKKILRILEL